MKFTILTLFTFLFLFLFSNINAQSPDVSWQKPYGGSKSEGVEQVKQMPDGGYVFAGGSNSIMDGNKTAPAKGSWDFWVVRTDANGDDIWQATAGGTGVDQLRAMDITDDGGVILGGNSSSEISGDKTDAPIGGGDYWVVKMDYTGAIMWDKTIGGTEGDEIKSMEQTTDGGYILGGMSFSGISGDKTEASFGSRDIWIVKLDSIGNIMWQKTLGGDDEEEIFDVQQTTDGGYIVGSYSMSGISGNKTEANKGWADYWIIKLSATGEIQWQKAYGGNDFDFLTSLRQAHDGGYIMVGQSDSSISGDKKEDNHGGSDYWVVKVDSLGTLEWENTMGGLDDDNPRSIIPTANGGYIAAGYVDSGGSGDISDDGLGGGDSWIVMMDENGNIVWDKIVGTADHIDHVISIVETSDRGYVMGGFFGFFTGGGNGVDYFGVYDFFTLKLDGCPPTTANAMIEVCNEYTDPNGDVYVASGQYTFTYSIPNAAGCDSLITVDLTVLMPTESFTAETACDEYTNPNGDVYAAAGNYTFSYSVLNAMGCDSVITVDLTMTMSSTTAMVETACDEYTSPNGEVITQSGTYTEMIVGGNMNGCDSMVTIDLTIVNIDVAVSQNDSALFVNEMDAQYQWLDCSTGLAVAGATNQNFMPTESGSYSVLVYKNGCSKTSECMSFIKTVSVKNNSFETEISLFPNPTSDKVWIDLGKNYEDVTIHVSNLLGQKIKIEQFDFMKKNELEMPREHGIYLIQIMTTEEKQQTIKVLKN